jgi:hypothetical protein
MLWYVETRFKPEAMCTAWLVGNPTYLPVRFFASTLGNNLVNASQDPGAVY